MEPDFHNLIRLVVIGDDGVGKTSVLRKFVDHRYSDVYMPTIGVDFKLSTMDGAGKRSKVQIWDTAGQERFRSITRGYYRSADGFIIVYDVTNQASFDHVQTFIDDINKFATDKSAGVLLIGNKCDRGEDRVVDEAAARAFADQHNLLYAETSAKEGINLATAFQSIVDHLNNRAA